MLQSMKALGNALVHAMDGAAGSLDQLLVDDITWTVRHLVIRIGGWIKSEQVLLPALAVRWYSPLSGTLYLRRTCQQIVESPTLATDPPVSYQQIMRTLASSSPPMYCCEPGMAASYAYMATLANSTTEQSEHWDPHLQSTDSFLGAAVAARDATFGKIDDLLVDDTTWRIRHVVVKTRAWGGKRVVIEPSSVRRLSWADSLAVIDMWRADIEQSPIATSLFHQKPSKSTVLVGWHRRW